MVKPFNILIFIILWEENGADSLHDLVKKGSGFKVQLQTWCMPDSYFWYGVRK